MSNHEEKNTLKRRLDDCSTTNQKKRNFVSQPSVSVSDALALIGANRRANEDDLSSNDRSADNSDLVDNRYDIMIFSDREVDCAQISTWLPDESVIVFLLRQPSGLFDDEADENELKPIQDERFCTVECDDCDAALALLIGVAALSARHIALLCRSSLARRCAEMIDDGAIGCSARIFDSLDDVETHVMDLFDGNNEDDDRDESQENDDATWG